MHVIIRRLAIAWGLGALLVVIYLVGFQRGYKKGLNEEQVSAQITIVEEVGCESPPDVRKAL